MEANEEIKQAINLDGALFAIDERSNNGIPAVELNMSLGPAAERVVLIFTSRTAAERYCRLKRPAAAANIFEFTRKSLEGRGVVQTGLIKVARVIRRDHPEITGFVLDHPGTRGPAHYLSVDDVAFLGRKKPDEIDADNFESALDSALES